MTRTLLSQRGPELAKKTFRANAKAQGLTFKAAAEARNLLPKDKTPIAPGMGRRSHGSRVDETYWNGHLYVHAGDDNYCQQADPDVCGLDGPDCDLCAVEDLPPWVLGADGKEVSLAPAPVLASLLDIAKPAKPRGVAKEFEVVDSVKRVIAFEDEVWEDERLFQTDNLNDDGEWEEWEELYEDWEVDKGKKVSYSEVVGGT